MKNEFIITPEMVAQMNDSLKQAQEFEEGMNERLEIATKKYNSLIGGLAQKTGYNFDFERFAGFISYHKINWKPLNSASFERLLHDFYKEEMNISNSFFDNNTPIDEKRILDIERKGKSMLGSSTPSHQVEVTGYDLGYSDTQLETLHKQLIERNFLTNTTKLEHFKNAFNGQDLVDFERLKWVKSYYASIFVWHLGHETPWQIAVKVFNNGSIDSLKNGYSPNNLLLSNKQKTAKLSLDSILKSLR